MDNNIKIVNYDDWELFSDRSNSINYLSHDKEWLFKISKSKDGSSLETVLKEKEISDNAVSLGIITPFVREVLKTTDGRYGIVYENIKDKKSISRAISMDFDNADFYIKKFTDMGNKIHTTKCNKNKYLSIEDIITVELDKYNIYSKEEKKLMHKLMDMIEKKDTFLQVDFQPGNIITSPKGEYVIDIGLMSYGNPIYDYAIWYLFSNMGLTDERANTLFHMTASQTKKCWDLYVKHQFGDLDIEKKTELENYLMAVSLLTFTSHLTSIPVFDVHKEMRDKYFELAYRKFM